MQRAGVDDIKHLGILGHSAEGAALCFTTFCQEGASRLGTREHPDVSLDCISFARCMPGYERDDFYLLSRGPLPVPLSMQGG